MLPRIHLAVDAMGGDSGPRLTVPASLTFLKQFSDTRVTLVGDSDSIGRYLHQVDGVVAKVVHAPDVIAGGDKPAQALRRGQQSSLWRTLELAADDGVDAAVSGGNTGALMAVGKHLLTTLGGVTRPAICKAVPAPEGVSSMLDLGANLDCDAGQLVEFAHMGTALARVGGISDPRVALLNVGIEATKGVETIREAAELLQALESINFCGFLEGDCLYMGMADVIVCDGFSGNVALKTSEGVARLLFSSLRERLDQNLFARVGKFLLRRQLYAWYSRFDPSRYNGAVLLGLRKTVVKSHGGADEIGFVQALATAREHALAGTPHLVSQQLTGAV